MTSLDDEARKSVQDAVDALRQWRNEVDAVNERGFTRAMDRIAAAQQAMGWPNRVTTDTGPSAVLPGKMHYFMVLDAVREQLLKSSKEDMRVIDKVAEACYASLQSQSSFSPQASDALQVVVAGDPVLADVQKRSKIPVVAGVIVALGAIAYASYNRVMQPVSIAVNNDKFVDGAVTNQKSAEVTAPNETSIPSSPQANAAVQQPEEKAPAPQSMTFSGTPPTTSAHKITVQLGALVSTQQAKRKWRELKGRSADLFEGHVPVITKAKRRGSVVWLLEIQDLSDKNSAIKFCESLNRKGAQCDIRETE